MSSPRSSRLRRSACLVAWLACAPALLGYALLTLGSLGALAKGGTVRDQEVLPVAFIYFSFACGWFAWYALVAISRSWLRSTPLPVAWPVAGTAAAITGFVPLASHWWPAALALPGIVLAVYLVIWHLLARRVFDALD